MPAPPPATRSTAPAHPIEALTRPETPAPPVEAPLSGPNIDGAVRMGRQLHAAGNLEPAIDVYRRVLAALPDHAEALHLMGVALHQSGDLVTALGYLERTVAASPESVRAWGDLGETYRNLQRFDDALGAFERALTLDETDHICWCNLAHALLQRGRATEAIGAYERAVGLGFEDTHLRTAEGVALKQIDRLDDAAVAFERALELDPSNPEPQYLLAAVRGEALPTAPAAYVQSLFDRYAPGYETHLVELLQYRGDAALLDAVTAVGLPDGPHWRIADLGCGTGLCGARFKPYSATLIGVDLSRAMIAEAWTRGIYDELVHDDLRAAFVGHGQFDLVTAGDVFIYVGDLDPVLTAAARAIVSGGLLAFTTESLDDDAGFRLRATGRFAHAASYLSDLAERCGFDVVTNEDMTVRTDEGRPIAGRVTVLRRR